jgi:hypothetical protein
MYKKTSDNEQSRARRTVEFSTQNDYGTDPTVFERENNQLIFNLVEQKRALEFKLGQVHRNLKECNPPWQHAPTALGAELKRKLLDQRDKIRSELADVMAQLMAAKAQRGDFLRHLRKEVKQSEKKELYEHAERTFEREFMVTAKQMLAGEIFDRIVVATIHRVRDDSGLPDKRFSNFANSIARKR